MQAAQNGVALAQLLAASGMSEHDYEHAVDEEAQAMAEQNAALDAIVDEYAIYVDETELPAILGLSPKDAKTVIDDAREHGGLEEVMAFARRRVHRGARDGRAGRPPRGRDARPDADRDAGR